jgi:hypothetical protein
LVTLCTAISIAKLAQDIRNVPEEGPAVDNLAADSLVVGSLHVVVVHKPTDLVSVKAATISMLDPTIGGCWG